MTVTDEISSLNLRVRHSVCRSVLRGLFSCLLLVGFCTPRTTHAVGKTGILANPAPSGVPFAFADFDGDQLPDVASVEASAGRTASTENYWVRLRLSSSGKTYIRLSAPRGGLLVEARDVNGDNAVDLILATAWLDQPIRILLNDGRGNFSQADPSSFPEALRKSSSGWNGSACSHFYPAALPRSSFLIGNLLVPCGELPLRNKELLRFQIARLVSDSPIALRAGRAPPSSTLL